jgi:hypothetical protein
MVLRRAFTFIMKDGIVSLTGNTIFGFYDVRLCKIVTGEEKWI